MPRIFDNRSHGKIGDFLKEKISRGSNLSIVSAYFTIYGYQELQHQLDTIDRLRFLYGEPRHVSRHDPEQNDSLAFRIEEGKLNIEKQIEQKWIARRCAEWIKKKVDVKTIQRQNFLHGKMYHISGADMEHGVVGSSNFTRRGLGYGSMPNVELNLEIADSQDKKDLKAWFDALWNDPDLVKDVKKEVIASLERFHQEWDPEFVYFKTLFHVFENFVNEQIGDVLKSDKYLMDTQIWKALYEFQRDGVRAAIRKIETYNGCIIADSVGLGKTYEALAVIKYFEINNGRVLVLCPHRLRENWTLYPANIGNRLNPFPEDRFGYTVLSHTDLSRNTGKSGDIDLSCFTWSVFDLVVIDESHNFRNNAPGRKDEDDNLITKSRYKRLMDDIIKAGSKTKLLLLSATPVNTDLKDLRNQFYFFTEEKEDAFKEEIGIPSLKETMSAAQRTFKEWERRRDTDNVRDLLDRLRPDFFKLLDSLTIARSRKHIKTYYGSTIQDIGEFPQRMSPESIYCNIDSRKEFMSYDNLHNHINEYKLSLFFPADYVLEEHQDIYRRARGNITQKNRERYLVEMMKVIFLKRLESSVHSFRVTLDRTIEKIEGMEKRIEMFLDMRDRGEEIDPETLDDEEDEELRAALEIGQRMTYRMAHLDVERWRNDLRQERKILTEASESAHKVTSERDEKLAKLKEILAEKIRRPSKNRDGEKNRKALVFTAFADTADYLYQNLEGWAQNELGVHIALITGDHDRRRTTYGGSSYFQEILTHFAPRAKQRAEQTDLPQEEEIDILIATDCISEGQNLQDCDLVINYDIHWNPVRLLQRFGRIDRIGSRNESIRMVNFWPTKAFDQYINLKNRVEARMALADLAATHSDNPLATEDVKNQEEAEDIIRGSLSYRDQQLLRLREEIPDLEEMDDSVTLSDFTLDDFRADLLRYLESNREKLDGAPFGLYAVAPLPVTSPAIGPGVIFCLKRVSDRPDGTVNPLDPYYLAYVRDSGEVRYGFAHPKQVLTIFRELCAGCSKPYEKLCDIFNDQTQQGQNMDVWSELLQSVQKHIERSYKDRTLRILANNRNAVLPETKHQVTASDNFDLVTWLVILDGDKDGRSTD